MGSARLDAQVTSVGPPKNPGVTHNQTSAWCYRSLLKDKKVTQNRWSRLPKTTEETNNNMDIVFLGRRWVLLTYEKFVIRHLGPISKIDKNQFKPGEKPCTI